MYQTNRDLISDWNRSFVDWTEQGWDIDDVPPADDRDWDSIPPQEVLEDDPDIDHKPLEQADLAQSLA